MPLNSPGASADTPPEHQLILRCARVNATAETAGQIRALLARQLDWGRVYRQARRHGVLPLLYRHLRATCPEAVPPALLDRLRDFFLRNTFRNLFLSDKLLQILRLFEEHDVVAVPYKGPVLTALAYGHLGLREFVDLDILVLEEDLMQVARLLLAQDYRLGVPLPRGLEAACVREAGELPLLHPDGTFVELHAALLHRDFHFPLDPRQLEARLGPVTLIGQEVRTFSREHLLLILCAHGAKHVWVSLGWVCDIAELIWAYPDMNWDEVLGQAKALRGERILFIGLLLARELLQAALPEEIVRRAWADKTARSLAARLGRRIFRDSNSSPGGMETALFHVRARERLGDGIRYCLSMALVPHFADWAQFNLPPSLSFLYYLIRPIRLAGKSGGEVLRRLLGRAAHTSPGDDASRAGGLVSMGDDLT
jgi:hypothetical protein